MDAQIVCDKQRMTQVLGDEGNLILSGWFVALARVQKPNVFTKVLKRTETSHPRYVVNKLDTQKSGIVLGHLVQ